MPDGRTQGARAEGDPEGRPNQGFDGRWRRGHGDARAPADHRRGIGGETYGGGVTANDDASFGGREDALGLDDRSWIDTCADDEISGHGHHQGRGPVGWSPDDRHLYEEVCERLLRDRLIDARGIEVEVENGVVILKGEARAAADPALAERLVRLTPGVTRVEVNLVVRPWPRHPSPPDPDERIDKSSLSYPILPT